MTTLEGIALQAVPFTLPRQSTGEEAVPVQEPAGVEVVEPAGVEVVEPVVELPTLYTVLDTCSILEASNWNHLKEKVQTRLATEGVHKVVLPGRVLTELVRASGNPKNNNKKRRAMRARANTLLRLDGSLLGVDVKLVKEAHQQGDLSELIRDSSDPDMMIWTDGMCEPGDGDFEIAHHVRTHTSKGYDSVLVTSDRALKRTADRLGISLLDAPLYSEEAVEPFVPEVPAPRWEETLQKGVNLLSLEAAYALLMGDLKARDGEHFVMLSSTLVRAAQRGVREVERATNAVEKLARLEKLEDHIECILNNRPFPRGYTCEVRATPRGVYEKAALTLASAPDKVLTGGDIMDMHTLLVLTMREHLKNAVGVNMVVLQSDYVRTFAKKWWKGKAENVGPTCLSPRTRSEVLAFERL